MNARRLIFVIIMGFFTFGVSGAFAQSYESLWKNYDDALADAKPADARGVVEKIVKKADKDKNFVQQIKSRLALLQCNTDIDAESFADGIAELEKYFEGRKDATERAMVHLMLAKAYEEIEMSWYYRFDDETCQEFYIKKNEHWSHVLDDMEALADASAKDYVPVTQLNTDGEVFGHDMLAVIVDFTSSNYRAMSQKQREEMYKKAADIYARRGNRDGEALMSLHFMNNSAQLHDLLMRCLDIDAGMDVAVDYAESIVSIDEKLDFIRWAEKNVKMSRAWSILENKQKNILRPYVKISRSTNDCMYHNSLISLDLMYWNSTKADIEVRKYNGYDKNHSLRKDGALVITPISLTFGNDDANQKRRAKDLPVQGEVHTSMTLPAGHYVVIAKTPYDEEIKEIHVTSMYLIVTEEEKDVTTVTVVDAKTGRLVRGATVKGLDRDEKVVFSGVTATDGTVKIKSKDLIYVKAEMSDDDYTDHVRTYMYKDSYWENTKSLSSKVYTDRSIYRPGQTVLVNVLLYSQVKDDLEVARNVPVTLELRSPSGKEKYEASAVTNEHGTADVQFVLPADGEVGSYSLVCKATSESESTKSTKFIRIEEYKRPTFDVSFPRESASGTKETSEYTIGQTVIAKGKAMQFSGAPVQGATVKYVIEGGRRMFRWWGGSLNELSQGETVTDDEGEFKIPVKLSDSTFADAFDDLSVSTFRVKAVVTDQSGESHEASWSVSVSNREFGLYLQASSRMDLDEERSFTVEAYDAQGEKVKASGKYTIKSGTRVIKEGAFNTEEEVPLPEAMPFGRYTINVSATDRYGNEIKESTCIWAFHSSAKPIVFQKHANGVISTPSFDVDDARQDDFFQKMSSDFSENKPARIIFAPEENDAYLIYNVYSANKLLYKGTAVLNNDEHSIEIPYSKEYGDGIVVALIYVRDGVSHSYACSFEYTRPDKRINLSWSTFRDKLQPGQQEEWTLNVTDKNGKPVGGAEMMAVMYDASLDQLDYHSWYFFPSFSRYVGTASVSRLFRTSVCDMFNGISLDGSYVRQSNFRRYYDIINEYRHNMTYSRSSFMRGRNRFAAVYEESAPKAMMAVHEDMDEGGFGMVEDAAESNSSEMTAGNSAKTEANGGKEEKMSNTDYSQASARTNFSETAFFMPHLVSDAKGNVNVAFTLPESLTEWHFMAFAHTDNLDYATLRDKVVARKDFMVRPNMPRFVRHGDKASIATSIINMSEKALNGHVRMRLINPVTQLTVLTKELPFSVDEGKTASVTFSFNVDESFEGVECEILAVSGATSDGEKNFLPVLTSKKDVVETVPFYILGKADTSEENPVVQEVDIKSLFNKNSATATQRHLAIEYTDNPSWMCIEALRSVRVPEDEDAVSYAASLHANRRLASLMKTYMLVAKYENPDSLSKMSDKAFAKLKKLQMKDGGWSWYEGMKASPYITLSVCEQLATIPSPDKELSKMLEDGLKWLDSDMLEDYERMLKNKRKPYVSNFVVRYLYLCGLKPERSVSGSVSKMREAYLSVLEKSINELTMYGVANSACALYAFKHEKAARSFVETLRQHTVIKPTQGRFFATDAAYYSWMDYRIPTQVAAMKAFMNVAPDDPYLLDMQLWLISQKQVQKWDNPMNTIDVADLMLKISPLETFHESKMPVVTLDGKKIDNFVTGTINTERDELEGREANLVLQGNVKADLSGEQLKDGVGTLSVTKSTPSVSWGVAYASFNEDVNNLTSHSTNELRIERKLYVQRGASKEWVELKENGKLHVGDKVRIRSVVTADRDMDFVRVRLEHPACFEPLRANSGYQYLGNRWGWLSIHDSYSELSVDWFTRGTTTLDSEYYVNRAGTYQVGLSSVECAYAKQFGGHTSGIRITVE